MLVDSTRKGKAFPDSLSRTVPVWAAVVNRAVAATRPVGDPAEWKALRPCFAFGARMGVLQSLDPDWRVGSGYIWYI